MTELRLFLHVFAGAIWVGGLLVLAALTTTLRSLGTDAPSRATRAASMLMWPAYAIAVLTGLWNVFVIPLEELQHPWIEVKVLVVMLSGIGAAVHQSAKGNQLAASIGGGVAALFAVASMYLGFLL